MRRLVRRTNEALECSRTSSAWRAVTSVSRGRRFSPPVLRCGLAGAAGLAAPPGRRERGAFSSSGSVIWVRASAPTLIFGLASSSAPPNRFLASCSALRLASSSCRRRSSSSRLRASAASRSVRSIASRISRMRACSSAILRSSASLRRASASACTRACCSSAVNVLSTSPDGLAGAAAAWCRPEGAPDRLVCEGGCGDGAGGGGSTLALPGARVFTFSTSTCLVRPWLKFWRTTLCSTPRAFSDNVLFEPTLNFFSPVFSVVSAIPPPGSRGFRTIIGAGPEALEARYARQKCLGFGTRNQDCMYHICPPECQIQLRNGKCGDDHDVFSVWPLPQASLELACAILAGIGGLDQGGNPFPAERGLYSGKANGGPTGLVSHGQCIERRLFEQPLGRVDQVAGHSDLTLETPGERLAGERVAERRARGGDPDTAPRQAPFEIGHDRAIRRQHKPDHLGDRRHLAGGCAEPLAAGRDPARTQVEPIVESLIVRSRLHAGVRPSP